MSAPLVRLGRIYESRDVPAGQSFFEQALLLDPEDSDALEGLARISSHPV